MLGRSTGLIIANTVTGAVLGFVALKLFAIFTGDFADVLLGQLAFAMGIAGLLSVFLDLGLGSAHIKRVSEGRQLDVATGSYASVKLLLAAGSIVLAAVGAYMAAASGVLTDTTPLAIVLVALFYGFLGLRTIFTATFDGRREFAKTQFTVLAENLTRAPLMVLFALAFAGAVLATGPLAPWFADGGAGFAALLRDRGPELLAATYALAALLSLLVGLWLFRRGYPVARPDPAVIRDYWGFARHIFVAVVVGTLYVSLDKVMITAFWAPSNTGQYFGAQRFSDLISMVPIAVYTVLFPALSASYARGDRAQAVAAVETAVRHVSQVVVPLVVVVAVMAAPLLSLVLTGVFSSAVPTLRLLALYALMYALLYPFASLIHAVGKPRLTARAAIVATVLNGVLNLLLIPAPGQVPGLPTAGLAEVGAAFATLVSVTVQFLLLRAAVHRIEGRVPMRHLGRHLVAGAAMAVALFLAAGPVLAATSAAGSSCTVDVCPEGAPWYAMLGLVGLAGLVYLAALVALREFTREDLGLYLHILDPKEMQRHLRKEIRAHGPGAFSPPAPGPEDREPEDERPRP